MNADPMNANLPNDRETRVIEIGPGVYMADDDPNIAQWLAEENEWRRWDDEWRAEEEELERVLNGLNKTCIGNC
jgi:hypothetical protein